MFTVYNCILNVHHITVVWYYIPLRASGSGCSEYYHLRDLNQERIVRRPTAYPAELDGHPLASYYYAYKVYYGLCIYCQY